MCAPCFVGIWRGLRGSTFGGSPFASRRGSLESVGKVMRSRVRRGVAAGAFAALVVGSVYGCGDSPLEDTPESKTPPGADATVTDDSSSSLDGLAAADTNDGDRSDVGAARDGNADARADADAGSDADADAGADADADAMPPPPAGPLSPTYVDYDISHILSTGQSNSVANGGAPPLTLTQPYSNLMFDTGPMSMKGSAAAPAGCAGINVGCCDGNNGCRTFETPASLVPLVEGDRFFDFKVESSSAGIANAASYLANQTYKFGARPDYPTKHDVLVTLHGRSGWTYQCLRKLYCDYKPAAYLQPFAQAMLEVQNAKALAAGLGKSYVVRAVTTVHGESDQQAYFAGGPEFPLNGSDGVVNKIKDYADGLVEWQNDYETSIQAITGQVIPIPLLVSQISGQNSTRVSQVAQFDLDAHVKAHGKVVLIGASYQLSVLDDCLHFDNHGYRRLGAYFAKVYSRIVFGGEVWEPVRPKLVTRVGAVITVKYYVPVPPLVIDTTAVTNPGNYGFDFVDGSGATPAIAPGGVAVSGPDTVTITLASAPVGPNMRLRYAQNQIPGTCIGPGLVYPGGARGNIRDSDDTPSLYTDAAGKPYGLQNWGVQYEVAVP